MIADLADGEAALAANNAVLEKEHAEIARELRWARTALHVSVSMLAKTTYQRDRAYAALYQRRDVDRAKPKGGA